MVSLEFGKSAMNRQTMTTALCTRSLLLNATPLFYIRFRGKGQRREELLLISPYPVLNPGEHTCPFWSRDEAELRDPLALSQLQRVTP